jgi:hypothetical protein
MSGPDDSDRSFLARWSQRKQEARQPEPKPDAQAVEDAESSGSPAPEGQDVAPQFDLSTLPKLEEMTGSTDVTAFLRKGVPEHLRNAALRKSWALDPAIRNYVSPALEYAYDWNAPGGVPGGGELDAGVDVARLVSQIMGEPAAETINSDSKSLENVADSRSGPTAPDLSQESIRHLNETDSLEKKAISTADDDNGESMSPEQSQQVATVAPQQPLRRHGTAKPII